MLVRNIAGVSSVSIHAPARGATHAAGMSHGDTRVVSIHAPARGATHPSHGVATLDHASFNPRSRAGSDVCMSAISMQLHASFNPRSRAGSDLIACRHAPRRYLVSIHAPRAGSDLACAIWMLPAYRVFQSTLPRGERPCIGLSSQIHVLMVSIHAPARGATP